ncbi:hypothetical protein D3C75_1189040 [compost metagenome]
MTSGGFSFVGGGVPFGKLILIALFGAGMVIINIIISTSMTSIRGVMLTSNITSSSLFEPTFIPIKFSLS